MVGENGTICDGDIGDELILREEGEVEYEEGGVDGWSEASNCVRGLESRRDLGPSCLGSGERGGDDIDGESGGVNGTEPSELSVMLT